MGCSSLLVVIPVTVAAVATLIVYHQQPGPAPRIPETGYWGPAADNGKIPADDENIYEFTVSYNDSMVEELKAALKRTKYVDPIEGAAYNYGVNLRTFREVIDYWRTKFDFKKAQDDINAFPNYRTEIEGLKIHFFRSAPIATDPSVKVLPLLMVHGWPGSIVEFLKIAPLLSRPVNGITFDVIVPSLPGFGFSQASSKPGVDVLVTARIFSKLMTRLGYSKFYMQGGDFGSFVTVAMAALYPERMRGIHVNLLRARVQNVRVMAKLGLFALFPDAIADSNKVPRCMPVPLKETLHFALEETGYYHIQATKPDTVGFGLLNSPAGLAAYILEKFSTGTNRDYRSLDDGGLTKKMSMQEILSDVMVYYASASILSSLRYYKENTQGNVMDIVGSRPITVPTGYSIFPNEIACVPRSIAEESFVNLTTISYHDDGGHFAALEMPDALAKDVREFVEKVETLYPEKLAPPKEFKALHEK